MSRPAIRPTVRLLESRVVDQIAAGEVVERPASVVKELVENALDAGATKVVVLLEDGGRARIRVEDDGHGMSEQEALLALERHATSKIRGIEDLVGVATLGFRGEALPSIAAVSRFSLTTRVAEAGLGTRLRLDAGTLVDVRPSGAAPGTVVDVRDLFHTLPARRAFLRSAPTEQAHAVEAVRRIALVRPEVGFEVRSGDRALLRAPAAASLADRGRAVLDLDEVVPILGDGLAGWWAPGEHRATAGDGLHLAVDGRWVRDRVLRNAITGALRDRVPAGRSPVLLLDLRLPPGDVDVNVHPTKAEVRFRDPAGVATRVSDALARLAGGSPRRLGAPRGEAGGLFERPSALPVDLPPPEPAPPEVPAGRGPWAPPPDPPAPPPGSAEGPALAAEPAVGPGRLLCLSQGRWAVIERGREIVVADAGRAARRRAAAAAAPGPRLLVPARLPLPARDVAALEAAAEALERFGLRVAALSPTEVVVRAVPEALADAAPSELVGLAIAALRGGEDPRARWGRQLAPGPITAADVVVAELVGDLVVGRVALP